MIDYEYKVMAAPTKGVKAKGKKTAEDRFSNALEMLMNEMAAEGWEYQRAEALPSTERAGLTSSKTVWHNVLVFRRRKPAQPEESLTALPPPEAETTDTPDAEKVSEADTTPSEEAVASQDTAKSENATEEPAPEKAV